MTVTINGVNDAAVIGGDAIGAVTEDATTPNLTDTGTLTISDTDGGEASFTAGTQAGTYGSLVLDAAGVWTYTAANNQAAIQALGAGDTLTDTFTVTSLDGTTHVVTVTINGVNDAAVIGGDAAGSVTEDTTTPNLTDTGTLTISDTDGGEASFTAGTQAGTYGSLVLDAAGVWTYTAANNQAAIQALGAGDTLTDTFTVTSLDGTTHVVTVTINGVNDAAVIGGDATCSVTEDTTTPNLTDTGTLTISDTDGGEASFTAGTQAGTYGSLVLDAAGVWTYTAANNQAAIQALGAGDTLTDTFTVTSLDGTAHVVTVTINGVNDAAVIGGDATGSVTEDATTPNLTDTGTLTISDTDGGEASFTAGTQAGTYGSLVLDTAGVWTYAAANNQAAIQALGAGDTLTDTFTVTSLDGTTHVVTITINGVNDAAVIGGDATGSVTEDATTPNLTDTGTLTISDTDGGEASFTAGTQPGTYGSLVLDAAGVWTYTAANNQAAIQALGAGDTLTDTFTVTSLDGTTHVVTVTINGANDAAVIGGDAAGAVTEDATTPNLTDTGTLTVTDTDTGEVSFTAGTQAGTYGSLVLDAAGVWTYTAANNQAAIQALGTGDTLTDTFTVTSLDGTTHVVTVTINGVNDAAVIGGDSTGSVTENATTPDLTDTGTLTISDADGGEASFTPSTQAGTYGSLALDAAGVWIYTAANDQAAIQTLRSGDSLTDTFTVTAVDGTTHVVTVTIHGANDAAVIGGDATGSVTEDATAPNLTDTGALTISDADAGQASFTAGMQTGAYGSLVLDAAGVWMYTAANNQAAIQALGTGDTLTDTFTVTSLDGTTHVVTITINGVNDVAVIGGDATGSVTEDATTPNVTDTGTLAISDTDSGEGSFTAGTLPGTYGSLALDAAGVWVYTAASNQAAIQALGTGDSLTDTFTVTSLDGTTHVVTITINGVNDAAVFGGDTTGSVTEDATTPNLTDTGTLTITDADDGEGTFTPGTQAGTYGSLVLDAAGNWTYTAANNQAAIQALGAGDTLTDTFTVTSLDGTTHVVTITINGTNGAPVAGDSTIDVNEQSVGTALGLSVPTDEDGSTFVITVTGLPSVGTVTLADGTVVTNGMVLTSAQLAGLLYNAPADLAGLTSTSFTYSVSDGTAPAVTGTVTINVAPVNDAPTAIDGTASGRAGQPIAIALTGSDIDGTIASVTVTLPPSSQGVLYLADGTTPVTPGMSLTPAQARSLVFVPSLTFDGDLNLAFTVTDDQGSVSSPATLMVTVASQDMPATDVPPSPVLPTFEPGRTRAATRPDVTHRGRRGARCVFARIDHAARCIWRGDRCCQRSVRPAWHRPGPVTKQRRRERRSALRGVCLGAWRSDRPTCWPCACDHRTACDSFRPRAARAGVGPRTQRHWSGQRLAGAEGWVTDQARPPDPRARQQDHGPGPRHPGRGLPARSARRDRGQRHRATGQRPHRRHAFAHGRRLGAAPLDQAERARHAGRRSPRGDRAHRPAADDPARQRLHAQPPDPRRAECRQRGRSRKQDHRRRGDLRRSTALGGARFPHAR